MNPNSIGHGVRERSVSVRPQHADVVVVEISYGQVNLTVTVEVSYRNRTWGRTHGVGVSDGKASTSIVQRHCDDIRSVICDCKIQCAVAVEISRNHELRKASRRDVRAQRKRAIAISRHDPHCLIETAGKAHGDIQLAIPVEIPSAHPPPICKLATQSLLPGLHPPIPVS